MSTGHIGLELTPTVYGAPQHETESQADPERLADITSLHRLACSSDEHEHDAGPDLPGAYVDTHPPSSPDVYLSTERE